MNISVTAYKPTGSIVVQSHLVNSTTNLHNAVYIKTNEDAYLQEVEYKLRQEFNDYLYEHYGKFNHKLCDYNKNKLWNSFKFDRRTPSITSYLSKLWEQFEEEYLL